MSRALVCLMAALSAACVERMRDAGPVMAEKPLIGKVTLDRARPCVGDDVLVRVEPIGADPGLTVTIDGELGASRILTIGRSGRRTIAAIVRSGNALEYASAVLEAADCGPRSTLSVQHWFAAADGVVQLEAGGAEGATLSWDFGDGTTASKPDRVVTKSYALRPQDSAVSTMVVTLTASFPDQRVERRRHTISFENPHFVSREAREIELPAEYAPMPRRRGGDATTVLHVRNTSPAEVRLSRARVRLIGCDGAVKGEEEVSLGTLFRDPPTVLAARVVWSAELVLPAKLAVNHCRADVSLLGSDGDGRAARVVAIVELGVPDNSQVVSDRALLDKIVKARKILGRSTVTHDELTALERASLL